MDWASNLFVVLLLTNITGTIFFLAGRLFRKQTERDVVFLRFLTMATLFAYLVPFVYIILYLGRRLSTIKVSNINLFYTTPLIQQLTAVLGCVWIGLFLVLLGYRLYRRRGLAELCRGNIPEEDEKINRVFEDICAELGIGGKVSLCRNDSVGVPCITYGHGVTVILPFKNYTVKEAEVIFYHELCHYLTGDLHLKTIGCIVALLHVFNPAVHIMLKETDMLCERYCDRVASKKGKNRFTVREYFQVIFESLVDEGKQDRYQLFALAENKSDCERRVEYMKGYRLNGGLRKGSAVVLAACFLLGSSITSLAAGDGLTNGYKELAVATKDDTVDEGYGETVVDDESLQEFVRDDDLDPEKVHYIYDDIETYGIKNYVWKVPKDETYVAAAGISLHVGDTVGITSNGTPDTVEYQVGIKEPDGKMRYVQGKGMIQHTFTINKDGTHYFYVTNLSTTTDLDISASAVY